MPKRFTNIEDFYKQFPNAKVRDAGQIEKHQGTARPVEGKTGILTSSPPCESFSKKRKKSPAKPPRMPTNAGFSFGKKLPEPENFEESRNLLPSLLAKGDSIKITLPYPPGTNNLFDTFFNRKTGVPRRVPSERYNLWRKAAQEVLDVSKKMVLTGRLGVRMKFYRPQRSGDWDGFIKAPQDILKGWFFIDDKQFVEGHVYQYEDPENPRVEIEIWEIY